VDTKNPRVLAVDDDDTILAGYRRGFGHTHEVFTATNALEALSLARLARPVLAVVDLVLKDESGIDLVADLRKARPRMTIVLVSGYLSTGTTVAAVKAGADYVLHKPTTASRILKEIERGDQRGKPLAEKLPTLDDVEWEHINHVLAETGGNISEAARRLHIRRFTLQRKIKRHASRR
jgi:two-component system response regulator RegA